MTDNWVDHMQKAIEVVDEFEGNVEMHDGPDTDTCLCCRFNRAMNELHDIVGDLRKLEAVQA